MKTFIVFLGILFFVNAQFDVLPGMEQIGKGYDIITGRKSYQNVVDFKYSDAQNVWVNPFNTSLIYSVPDNVQVMEYYSFETTSSVYRSTQEYAKDKTRSAGLTLEGSASKVSAFSLSPEFKHVQSVIENHENMFSETTQFTTINKIDVAPVFFLDIHPTFEQYVDTLPSQYDKYAYRKLISDFGTHVIVSGVLGGRASMESIISSQYSNVSSDTVISANAKVQFGLSKGTVGTGGSFSKETTSREFSEYSSTGTKFTLEGGNPYFRDISKWSEWVKTVKHSPSLVKFHLSPISKFIKDSQKSSNALRAILEYSEENAINTPEINPPPLKLGSCDCISVSTLTCPTGYAIRGVSFDSDNDFFSPMTCCKPCLSWKATGAFSQGKLKRGLEDIPKPLPKKLSAPLVDNFAKHYSTLNSAYQNNNLNSNCGTLQCVPGHDRIGIGFDLVTGNKKNIQVIDFTFNQKKEFMNPHATWLKYNYPDQCDIVSETKFKIETSLFKSQQEYASHKAVSAGISVALPGMFSLDSSVEKSSEIFSRGESVMVLHTETPELYVISLPPSALLQGNTSSNFIKMVDMIPDTYNEEYLREFVSYFGTHYIQQASFGGKAVMRTIVDQRLFSSKDETGIKTSASVRYQAFKAGGNIDTKDKQTLENLESSSFSELYLEGGNFEDFTVANWEDWVNTTQYAPVEVNYKVEPLYNLIRDPVKRDYLRKYIDSYLAANAITSEPVKPASFMDRSSWLSPKDHAVTCDRTYRPSVLSGFMKFSRGRYVGDVLCTSFDWKVAPVKGSKISKCDCEILSGEPYRNMCPMGKYINSYKERNGFWNWYPTAPIECCALCYE